MDEKVGAEPSLSPQTGMPPEQPAGPLPDIEILTQQERGYLIGLEERNRVLTMDLGDLMVELETRKQVLLQHRQSLTVAYAQILRVRNIVKGDFDSMAGVIHVTSRKQAG